MIQVYTGRIIPIDEWHSASWYRVATQLPAPVMMNDFEAKPRRLLIAMEDESTGFAYLSYFQRNGVFNAVRFERCDEGKDGPERTEYRLRDVIAWMELPEPPAAWFGSELAPLAKDKALAHAERWAEDGRGTVRSFELKDGSFAVTLIGKGISAALFVGCDGFEWLRFRDDSEYYFGCNDADEWPIFWAWLATAPAGAKPASLAYELLPYDPIAEGM